MGSGVVDYDREGNRLTAATPEEMTQLKATEEARKRYDPSYISHDEAMSIPDQLLSEDPSLAFRVRESAKHWPEGMAPVSEIFTNLPGGSGETVTTEAVDSATLFTGRQVGDAGEAGEE